MESITIEEQEDETEYEEENPLTEKEQKIERMKGTIFLTWFIISLIMFLVAAGLENGYLVIMNFGQYFLVFGLLAYKSSKHKAPLIAVLVGLACILIPLFIKYGPKTINIEVVMLILLLIVLLIVGLCLIIIPISKYYKELKLYSSIVPATIILYSEMSNDIRSNNILYAPTYKYEYNGKEYKIRSKTYRKKTLPEGSLVNIRIDPNRPDIIYKTNLLNLIVPVFIGIILLLVPILIVSYFITNIRKYF